MHGSELAVVELGPGDAPAVLVVPGAGSSARFVCEAFGDAVVSSGRRLITYDPRGHGASNAAPDPEEHHLDVHVADLIEVTFGVDGEVAVVGGVSLGAHAAVRMVASRAFRPHRVLACLPAWTGEAMPGEGPHAVVAAELRHVGVEGVLRRLHRDRSLPRWLQATLLTDYPRHDPASLTAALAALDGGEAPSEAELQALPVPLAVVGWPDDPGHPLDVAQTWADTAPRGALGRCRIDQLDADVGVLGRVAMATIDQLT